jgi:hypothetical protein
VERAIEVGAEMGVVGGAIDVLELFTDARDDHLGFLDVLTVNVTGTGAVIHVPGIAIFHPEQDVQPHDIDGDVDDIGHAAQLGGLAAELSDLQDREQARAEQRRQDQDEHRAAKPEIHGEKAGWPERATVTPSAPENRIGNGREKRRHAGNQRRTAKVMLSNSP